MADAVRKKILVVDDDQFLREMYVGTFTEARYDVAAAADGQEAWEKIAGGYVPDIVFTGILMPRMTGFDLIRKMQADPKLAPIPVVIFSHRGREEDKQTAKELNVDDFVLQGVVPLPEIVRRVSVLVGNKPTFRVYLKRYHDDAEALIKTLDNQQQTSILSNKADTCFLELTPQTENGSFTVKVVTGPPTD